MWRLLGWADRMASNRKLQHNYPRIFPRINRAAERLVSMDEFDRYRADMNEKLLVSNHLGLKRFFALDTQAYEDGALDKRTKELLGLVEGAIFRSEEHTSELQSRRDL